MAEKASKQARKKNLLSFQHNNKLNFSEIRVFILDAPYDQQTVIDVTRW
jgi:hypothetical protein